MIGSSVLMTICNCKSGGKQKNHQKISWQNASMWLFAGGHHLNIIFGGLEPRTLNQRYTHRVLQIIQLKLILLCVWAERAVLGSAKLFYNSYIKFKQANTYTIQCMGRA